MKTSLSQHLIKYLRQEQGFCNGGELERKAMEWGYKGSTASRVLRTLYEDGMIDRDDNLDRKHTVWYRAKAPKVIQRVIHFPEGDKVITESIW